MFLRLNNGEKNVLVAKKPDITPMFDNGESVAPYLNLIRAMFERLQNDLTVELIIDVAPQRRSKGAKYMQHARAKAYKFFFDETSGLYQDFLAWCNLTGFNPYFWRKKAVAAVALKIIQSPKFRERVVEKLCDAKTLADIDAMIGEIIRFNQQKWVM